MSNLDTTHRILIVDDNTAIHEDFRLALDFKPVDTQISETKSKLFGKKNEPTEPINPPPSLLIDSAYQGKEALEQIIKANAMGKPYALAFVDIRMPPGWDGIETIQKIFEVDPDIEIVICSAYSDYSWEDMSKKIKASDNVLILKKPFDVIEIRQLASTLTKKWSLKKKVREQIENLKELTHNLEHSLSLTQATLESTQEGIIVLDQQGKVVMCNKIFQNLWNVSRETINKIGSDEFLKQLSIQVEDSAFFIKVMTDAIHQQNPENAKKWKLKSGKILELYICPQYLHDKIVGSVCSFRDITELEKLTHDLLHQATHDTLTALPNRILLADRVKQAVFQAKNLDLPVGILLFDLDNFKHINDSLGHNTGDLLLQLVAKRVSACVNANDTVTRLGGDEFVVVITSYTTKESIAEQAKKILTAISAPFEVASHELIVTSSMGISVYPQDGEDLETLLKNADAALYHAKGEGRNKFQFYTQEFNELMLQRLELTTALRMAIERNQFRLDYQPLLELDSGKIIGVEALLRWQHPTLGEISPKLFVPIAEEAGLIVSIGEWVLRSACEKIKLWHQMGYNDLKVSVNISPRQFQQDHFVDMLISILSDTALNPKYLELEITEQIILNNISESIKKMMEIKEIGINLAIDDFGTGYSSLSYLKYFSFDKIKIDKSFIDGVGKNGRDNSIVEAIMTIAKQYGITILAEGVEKEDQIQFMKSHQGSQIQGYYFSKPLKENELTNLLSKEQSKQIV